MAKAKDVVTVKSGNETITVKGGKKVNVTINDKSKKESGKKSAVKKAVKKKPAVKKTVVKKTVSKKAPIKKKAVAKKPAGKKKTTAKKAAVNKTPAVKKAGVSKVEVNVNVSGAGTAKKAVKKAVAKKPAKKKSAVKKASPIKKKTVAKAVKKKNPAKKAVKKKVESKKVAYINLATPLRTQVTKISGIDKSVSSLEKTVNAMEKSLKGETGRADALRKMINNNTGKVNSVSSKLSTIQRSVNSMKTGVETGVKKSELLEKQLSSFDKAVTTAVKKLEDHDKMQKQTEQEYGKRLNEISSKIGAIGNSMNVIKTSTEKTTKALGEMNKLSEIVKQTRTETAELGNIVNQVARPENIEELVDEKLDKRMNEIKGLVEDLKGNLNEKMLKMGAEIEIAKTASPTEYREELAKEVQKIKEDFSKEMDAIRNSITSVEIESGDSDLEKMKTEELEKEVEEAEQETISELEQLKREIRSLNEKIEEMPAGEGLPREQLAHNIVNTYFSEVARIGFKRKLSLEDTVKAYNFVLVKLRDHKAVTPEMIEAEINKGS